MPDIEPTKDARAVVLTELEHATKVYRAACGHCGWRGQAYTVDTKPNEDAQEHKCPPFESLTDLVLGGLYDDGSHHKQYALFQIARVLGIRVEDGTDEGIPG